MRIRKRTVGLLIYFGLLLMPIYWMLNMSLRTNADILGTLSLFPTNMTLKNYVAIFTDEAWYSGYINSITYVTMNTVLSLSVALPAAYAFLAFPLPRRQAHVLLAADQPDGATGGVPAAVLPALFDSRID